ncbi:macrophage mannose receptor 1-like [Oreochromis aureus]|uniref:macrophage mannose receptor 1-like n=1 Tax=Oreochromis aureus TaxID=47969 RepID=UPI0019538FD0|nr:macrophage mannose receptor 1-like [Oreochromis aureus]
MNIPYIWIGLLRDPEDDSVWKSINLRTGEGVSGDDLSRTIKWASAQQDYCAVVGNDLMCWYDAVKYCMENYGYLATVTQVNSGNIDKGGWIGLYRVGGKTWNWTGSLGSSYRNWAPGQPVTADCGSVVASTGGWVGSACSKEFYPFCFVDNLVVVNENKTWEDALIHCRRMKTSCSGCKYDLLSLTDVSQYNYVRDRIYRATTDEAWIGLRFMGGKWFWLNGDKPGPKDMLPDCPPNWEHCGTLSKFDTNSMWMIRDCAERRNFVCIQVTP